MSGPHTPREPVFDPSAFYANVVYIGPDGDADLSFAMTMVDDFLERVPIEMAALCSHVRSHDLPAVRSVAHTLKSLCATFGAQRLAHLLVELEGAALGGDGDAVARLAELVGGDVAAAEEALDTQRRQLALALDSSEVRSGG